VSLRDELERFHPMLPPSNSANHAMALTPLVVVRPLPGLRSLQEVSDGRCSSLQLTPAERGTRDLTPSPSRCRPSWPGEKMLDRVGHVGARAKVAEPSSKFLAGRLHTSSSAKILIGRARARCSRRWAGSWASAASATRASASLESNVRNSGVAASCAPRSCRASLDGHGQHTCGSSSASSP
jgi:hypothetical protein